jgi:large subunit ribosomal protein L14
MLKQESKVIVADNTQAKRAQIIRVKKGNTRTATVGDIVVVTIKDASPTASVKK